MRGARLRMKRRPFVRIGSRRLWEWFCTVTIPHVTRRECSVGIRVSVVGVAPVPGQQFVQSLDGVPIHSRLTPSRGAGVVGALFGEIRPRVWVSDSLGSQRGHADIWQVCLAHLLRDAQYAID